MTDRQRFKRAQRAAKARLLEPLCNYPLDYVAVPPAHDENVEELWFDETLANYIKRVSPRIAKITKQEQEQE